MFKTLVKFLKQWLTQRVQGFLMGAAVAYPGLVDFLTSYFK